MKTRGIIIASIGFMLVAVAGNAEEVAASSYHPESQSSFSPGDVTRSPFWPIGWQKQAKVVAVKKVVKKIVVNITPELFSITSILMGELPIAVMNDGEYTVGEFFPVTAEGNVINVKVEEIGDGYVKIRYKDQVVTVNKTWQ